jgi:hypothetical protein
MGDEAYKDIRDQAALLDRRDKLRLIAFLARELKREEEPPPPRSFPSVFGIFKDLGPAPSAEEIDEARREAWSNFPREDI